MNWRLNEGREKGGDGADMATYQIGVRDNGYPQVSQTSLGVCVCVCVCWHEFVSVGLPAK